MTIRRVTLKEPVTAADIGRYSFSTPDDQLALCDGPWEITGMRDKANVPLVDVKPVWGLNDDAEGPTCCSPQTILFVVDTLAEAKQLMALNRSQLQQSESALREIRERVAAAVVAAIRASPDVDGSDAGRATGRKSTPKRSVHQRKIDAETLASRWLADGNAARERGDTAQADLCYAKSQYWKDRAILLAGEGDRAAPKR